MNVHFVRNLVIHEALERCHTTNDRFEPEADERKRVFLLKWSTAVIPVKMVVLELVDVVLGK